MKGHYGLFVALIFLALPLSAAPITVTFSGTIVSAGVDEVYGDVGFGTAFSGSFTFESTASDGAPADSSTGSYTSLGAPYIFSVTVGSHPFSTSDSLNVSIFNSVVDQYTVLGQATDLSLQIFLQDDTAAVFGNDSLPAGAPPLASFTTKTFRLDAIIGGGQVQYDGIIDSLTSTAGTPGAVPEPSTFLLALAGAVAFGARRFIRRGR